METTAQSYDAWVGHDVYDSTGEKIGEIKDIFYDDVTNRPEWLAVKGGILSGTTFVPIQGATRYSGGDDEHDDDLQVNYTKDFIKAAPSIDLDDDHMRPEQERELWQYFEYDYDTRTKTSGYGYGKSYGKLRPDVDYTNARYNRQTSAWDAPDAGDVVAEATAVSEDVQKVEQAETVRLRKYQHTEMVPVTKEEVRVEKGPASEATTATASTRTTRRDA